MLRKQIEANNSTFPTVYQCALMSQNVYDTGDKVVELDGGWRSEKDYHFLDEMTGYHGRFFIKDWDSNDPNVMKKIAFVHRGTVPEFSSIINDIINDADILFKQTPEQCYSAWRYIKNVLKQLNIIDLESGEIPSYFPYLITNTGHSLGAVISDVMAASLLCKIPYPALQISYTLENPGALNAIKSFCSASEFNGKVDHALEILSGSTGLVGGVAILRDPNIVNTCREQAVRTARIYTTVTGGDYFGETDLPYPKVEYFLGTHWMTHYLLYQHDIHKIVELLRFNDNPYMECKYSTKLATVYANYLCPTDDDDVLLKQQSDVSIPPPSTHNREYWIGYGNQMYRTNTKLQEAYKNEGDFHSRFFDNYMKNVYAQASARVANQSSFGNSFNMFKTSNDIVKEFHIIEKDEAKAEKSSCLTM